MKVTDKQFKFFSDLVYRECGINLHEGKKQLLQARLAKRLRHTGIQSVSEYLDFLADDSGELIHFLDAISTNHTFFFRESQHFECLQAEHEHIWCAASSSGEEPYSIMIYCLEKGFRPHILATDISTKVLGMANRGIYPGERVKNLPINIMKKYFQKGQGQWADHIKVKDEIKRTIRFERFNLLTNPLPHQQFNVIFCRNVLIYFDNFVKEKVINKLYSALKINGFLIIGGAESLTNVQHKYKYIRPSVYKKVS
jgi:chemotaxis protein methyltransferase CheR